MASKRIKIKMLIRKNEWAEVWAENYDEFAYFVNMKFKENKELDLAFCNYRLVDKAACITIVSDDDKKKLIEKYSERFKAYQDFMKTKEYEKYVKEKSDAC